MVWVSSLYFKPDFVNPFSLDQIETSYFTDDRARCKELVVMMAQRNNFHWADLPELDCTMLELACRKSSVVMQILLPNKNDGLERAERGLDNFSPQLTFSRRKSLCEVALRLPAFKFNKIYNMKKPLTNLGLKDIFDDEANYKPMMNDHNLTLSKLLQIVRVDVVPKVGAESVPLAGGGVDVIEFDVDRPFLFFIYDTNTEMVLAQGRIVNPNRASWVG